MTVGGKGIPRLHELAYLETVARTAGDGQSFENTRLALVDHIWAYKQSVPGGDPPDPAAYQQWRSDEKKFVRNVTDALKELMRLGFVEKAQLPSTGRSAYAHKDATYSFTASGKQWVELLAADRRLAYDDLIPRLVLNHPGFARFLRAVGTLDGDADQKGLVIPLLHWSQLPSPRSQDAYRASIGDYVARALASSDLGWNADASEIGMTVNSYLDRILARAQARGRDPFPTVRAFTDTCEESLATFALAKAGCPMDNVSMEIARRWSRWLGLASFTHHVPGPAATLRFWSTARLERGAQGITIERRAGGSWRDAALAALYEHCQQARAAGTTYVPVWEVRAAVCWRLRIVDDEFDRAVTEMIAGHRGLELPWGVHLDQVSVGSARSVTPFVLTTSTAGTRTYNVMTVVPKTSN